MTPAARAAVALTLAVLARAGREQMGKHDQFTTPSVPSAAPSDVMCVESTAGSWDPSVAPALPAGSNGVHRADRRTLCTHGPVAQVVAQLQGADL
jgi:hypothetical protein